MKAWRVQPRQPGETQPAANTLQGTGGEASLVDP